MAFFKEVINLDNKSKFLLRLSEARKIPLQARKKRFQKAFQHGIISEKIYKSIVIKERFNCIP